MYNNRDIYHFPINNNLLILREDIRYRVTGRFMTLYFITFYSYFSKLVVKIFEK